MSPTHSPMCLWQNQPRIKRLILHVILQLLHRYYDQVFHNICGTFESDSINPVIISKHPTSPLHLKVHLFYYFCYLLMSQIRGSCITFLTTSNLLLLQCLLMEQIVVLKIATRCWDTDLFGFKKHGAAFRLVLPWYEPALCICSNMLQKFWCALCGKGVGQHGARLV